MGFIRSNVVKPESERFKWYKTDPVQKEYLTVNPFSYPLIARIKLLRYCVEILLECINIVAGAEMKVRQWWKKNSFHTWGIGESCSTFTFIHLADAFIQSDFQERALQKCIGL